MRNQPPTCCSGSKQLMYMLSLKFGSGPSSCMYSSDGSRRTAMRPTVPKRGALPRPEAAATSAAAGPAAAEAAATTALVRRARRDERRAVGLDAVEAVEAMARHADVPEPEARVVGHLRDA